MGKISKKLGQALSIIVIIIIALITLTFLYLYVLKSGGFLYNHRLLFSCAGTLLIAIFTAIAIVFQLMDKTFVYRFCLMVLITSAIALFVLYLLKICGFWDKVDSAKDLREFIAQTGSFAVIFFIIMQILQVVVLPIPGIIMIGAGTLLFGALKGAILSFIGIFLGSIIGFAIGRYLGYRWAKWLVGDGLDKALESVKGKDKIVLSFMFLFPFFPDDVLCFVSGMSSMSWKYYFIMISITRLISTFFTSFSASGSLIPYNTWWGILIWCIIFVLTIIIAVFIYKNGEKIERKVGSFFAKKD